MQPRSGTGKTPSAQERLIDEMVEESLPASDAPQLTGWTGGAPGTRSAPSEQQIQGEQPTTIGNQGVVPASRMVEETVPLADQGVVTLRFDAEHQRLHLFLGEDGLSLDAKAVDRLIAVLSEKRAQMA